MCILITSSDIFNIPRLDVVNWIHLFPFSRSDYEQPGFSDISRGYASAMARVSLFSAISIASLRCSLVIRTDLENRLYRTKTNEIPTGLPFCTQLSFLRSNRFPEQFDYSWFSLVFLSNNKHVRPRYIFSFSNLISVCLTISFNSSFFVSP